MIPGVARSAVSVQAAVSARATALVRVPLRLGAPSRPQQSTASASWPRRPACRPYATASASPPPRRPWIRPSTAVFLLLGAGFGLPLYGVVAQLVPTLPERGSAAEDDARADLETRAARLPLVVQLTTDPAWVEWAVGSRWKAPHDHDAPISTLSTLSTLSTDSTDSTATDPLADPLAEPPRQRLTRNALGGVQGMTGYHRVFLHPHTGELVSIVHLGHALSGFPTRAHGGALATLLDEALGRCAIHTLPARTGVTARLELQYRRPVAVPGFYVVRCHPELPPGSPPEASKDLRKLWCSATLETPAGQTCVEARGLFVVPKGYKLGRVEDRF